MKSVRILTIVLLVAACQGTVALPPPGPGPGETTGPASGPAFSACATDAIKKVASGLLDDVMSALATSDYEGALTNLLTKATAGEVKCAVQYAVASLTRKAGADELAADELARGQAWLKKN